MDKPSNKRHKCVTAALLFVIVLLLNIGMINVSSMSAQPPEWDLPVPRDKTISVSGYWPDPAWATSVPCIMDWSQCWDTYIMYEPLFGVDRASNRLIKWLGENIEWLDSTTIKIMLRKKDIGGGKYAPYWVKITDWDAWQACTGGVEYYRPINTTDVKYSLNLTDVYQGIPGLPEGLVNASWDSFMIISDKEIHVRVNETWAQVVYSSLTKSYLIMPFDVWQQIEQQYPWVPDFPNDWTNNTLPGTPPEWRVASGMYLPYMRQTTEYPHYVLMKENPLWWGIRLFGRRPAPNYCVYKHYDSYEAFIQDLINGGIDWCGIAVPNIGELMQQYCFLHTYLYDPPYYVDEGADEFVVPNHRRWPLGEQWLHHAMCHILNFSSFGAGYLIPPSPLYLPKNVRNETINAYFVNEYFNGTYVQIPYVQDVQEAIEILNATCYYIYNGTIQGWNSTTNRPYNWPNGAWYTKEGPCQQWLENYLTDDVNLTIGQITHSASYWLKHGLSEADQLPNIPGVNVQLGPWTIIDIEGWTDGNYVTLLIANWTKLLDITLTAMLISYSEYEQVMDELSYDFSHYYSMPHGLGSTVCEVYKQLFTGNFTYVYAHLGDYRNPTLETLLDLCDSFISRIVLYKAEYAWGKYDNGDSVVNEPPYSTFAGEINADNVKRSDDVRETTVPITWNDYAQHIFNFTLPLGITKDMVVSINVTWEGFIDRFDQGSAGELMVWNHTSLQWNIIATILPSTEDIFISVSLPSNDYIDQHGRIYVMAMAYPSWEPPPLLATDYIQVELKVSLGNMQEIANKVQWIVGSDEPLIPIANTPHPYIYSDLYWVRWPHQNHPFLPCSPYGGSSQTANLHFLLLALGSSAPGAYADIDNNHVVELIDILETKKAYGSYPCHERWDFTCDIAPTYIVGNPPKLVRGDGKVDLQDILEVKKNYGKTW
ncbi:MAG: hypothetical protein QW270_03095 [Candidatus Bathyarchaeia archaeon]